MADTSAISLCTYDPHPYTWLIPFPISPSTYDPHPHTRLIPPPIYLSTYDPHPHTWLIPPPISLSTYDYVLHPHTTHMVDTAPISPRLYVLHPHTTHMADTSLYLLGFMFSIHILLTWLILPLYLLIFMFSIHILLTWLILPLYLLVFMFSIHILLTWLIPPLYLLVFMIPTKQRLVWNSVWSNDHTVIEINRPFYESMSLRPVTPAQKTYMYSALPHICPIHMLGNEQTIRLLYGTLCEGRWYLCPWWESTTVFPTHPTYWHIPQSIIWYPTVSSLHTFYQSWHPNLLLSFKYSMYLWSVHVVLTQTKARRLPPSGRMRYTAILLLPLPSPLIFSITMTTAVNVIYQW